MRRSLPLLVLSLTGAILLSGCGGFEPSTRKDAFQEMVDDINAQHPPLYDGTNTVYPPSK